MRVGNQTARDQCLGLTDREDRLALVIWRGYPVGRVGAWGLSMARGEVDQSGQALAEVTSGPLGPTCPIEPLKHLMCTILRETFDLTEVDTCRALW